MPINLLAKEKKREPINLLKTNNEMGETQEQSFNDLSDNDKEQVLELSRKKIEEQYPNAPQWLRDFLLHVTPKEQSPLLDSASRGISNVTDYIPAAAGGFLQGASLPIRGVASTVAPVVDPIINRLLNETSDFSEQENQNNPKPMQNILQGLADSPDLRGFFPKPMGVGQKSVQDTAEFFGAAGPYAKLFGTLKKGTQLAKIPKFLQNTSALAGTGFIGTPGNVADKEIGAAEALLLGGAGKVAGKVASKVSNSLPAFLRGLTSKSSPQALVESVQKPHDVLQNTADTLYDQVRLAINKRKIEIPIKHEYLSQIEEILPKTRANKILIEKAKTGDYQAVHDLQSHLYKKGTKGLSSDDIALENQGEEILDLRDKVNDELESHLLKEGHIDIAHVLKQGKKTVAQLKKNYFAPHLRKGIGKMVHKDIRLVPENPQNLFNENSLPMKQFLEKHPETAKHLKGLLEKEMSSSKLKKLLLTSGIGGGIIGGGKSLYDLLD